MSEKKERKIDNFLFILSCWNTKSNKTTDELSKTRKLKMNWQGVWTREEKCQWDWNVLSRTPVKIFLAGESEQSFLFTCFSFYLLSSLLFIHNNPPKLFLLYRHIKKKSSFIKTKNMLKNKIIWRIGEKFMASHLSHMFLHSVIKVLDPIKMAWSRISFTSIL